MTDIEIEAASEKQLSDRLVALGRELFEIERGSWWRFFHKASRAHRKEVTDEQAYIRHRLGELHRAQCRSYALRNSAIT